MSPLSWTTYVPPVLLLVVIVVVIVVVVIVVVVVVVVVVVDGDAVVDAGVDLAARCCCSPCRNPVGWRWGC